MKQFGGTISLSDLGNKNVSHRPSSDNCLNYGNMPKKKNTTVRVYFHVFCDLSFFRNSNSAPLATPDSLSDSWSNHEN